MTVPEIFPGNTFRAEIGCRHYRPQLQPNSWQIYWKRDSAVTVFSFWLFFLYRTAFRENTSNRSPMGRVYERFGEFLNV